MIWFFYLKCFYINTNKFFFIFQGLLLMRLWFLWCKLIAKCWTLTCYMWNTVQFQDTYALRVMQHKNRRTITCTIRTPPNKQITKLIMLLTSLISCAILTWSLKMIDRVVKGNVDYFKILCTHYCLFCTKFFRGIFMFASVRRLIVLLILLIRI